MIIETESSRVIESCKRIAQDKGHLFKLKERSTASFFTSKRTREEFTLSEKFSAFMKLQITRSGVIELKPFEQDTFTAGDSSWESSSVGKFPIESPCPDSYRNLLLFLSRKKVKKKRVSSAT